MSRSPGPQGGIAVDVKPPWPYRMATRGGPDQVSRVRAGVYERFLHVERAPILIRAWERPAHGDVRIAAIPVEPEWLLELPSGERGPAQGPPRASRGQLETALARARNALAVDDDYTEFYARFRSDPVLARPIREFPWLRARRAIWPWEAFAWGVTEQLIEVERAHAIQRRIIARWGAAMQPPDRPRPLRDVPDAATIAARSPAELVSCGLAPKRALALRKAAREIAARRIDPGNPGDDRRLLAISEIGPWTVQVLGRSGRGEPDSLPAGDLAYLKLVPHLIGLERRATVAEVEDFYSRFAPWRGWAGLFTLVGYARKARSARPIRYHPPRPELEAA